MEGALGLRGRKRRVPPTARQGGRRPRADCLDFRRASRRSRSEALGHLNQRDPSATLTPMKTITVRLGMMSRIVAIALAGLPASGGCETGAYRAMQELRELSGSETSAAGVPVVAKVVEHSSRGEETLTGSWRQNGEGMVNIFVFTGNAEGRGRRFYTTYETGYDASAPVKPLTAGVCWVEAGRLHLQFPWTEQVYDLSLYGARRGTPQRMALLREGDPRSNKMTLVRIDSYCVVPEDCREQLAQPPSPGQWACGIEHRCRYVEESRR